MLFDFQAEKGSILAVQNREETELKAGLTIPVEDFVVSDDLLSGQDRILPDLRKWNEGTGIHDKLIAEGILSVANIPMMVKGRLIGALNMGAEKPRAFAEEEIEVAREVANQLAIAVEQARLNQRIQAHAEELERRVEERTRELEESNRALRDFTYSVSHDFRTPLRAIKGFGEIIAQRHRDSLNEQGRHYFDNILEAADNMEVLIDDLLAYSRLGRETPQAQSLDLASLTKDLINEFDSSGSVQGAKLMVEGDLPTVTAVPSLLKQALANLIDNALKYRRKEGSHRVVIRGGRTDQGPYVEVADNGIGIASEYLEKIFDIFQRLHPQNEYPGTGIGLAMVKKAAGLMGAQVTVRSQPGEGSVFRLVFLGQPTTAAPVGNSTGDEGTSPKGEH